MLAPIKTRFFHAMKRYCNLRGWLWYLQAPQMPCSNNLDLLVFPAMSKCHSLLLAIYLNNVASSDKIFNACEDVWNKLESLTVAAGYPLAFLIAKKVIQGRGDNSFLKVFQFHFQVHNNFMATEKGVKRQQTTKTTKG